MKILYVNLDAGIDWCGYSGGATHIQAVLRAMSRLGHTVHILVSRSPQRRPPDDLVVPCYSEADHVPWDQFDVVYERYSIWSELSLQHSLPWILEVNAPLIEEQVRYRAPIDVSRATEIRDTVFQRVQRIIVISSLLLSYITADARGKTDVVPNSVDRNMFFPRPLRSFAFGYVGSFRPWHDLDTPLKAFVQLRDRYPDIHFRIAGASPSEDHYREQYTDPHIHFHGAVPHAQVPDFLGNISCGIALFKADAPKYFSPLKIQEYLATHRTVLTHPQFVEYPEVTDGVQGLAATLEAMERQINLDRSALHFPRVPDWSESLAFL